MNTETASWQPFHPERGRLPAELQLPASETGQVVLVSALRNADEAQWSARTAVRISREWAEAGARVFLADLGFDAPMLHTVLGEENGEGMTDALLYGASIQRVAHPVGEGFFFAPAGTITAPSVGVLEHAGWQEMIDGFVAAGVTLVLFVPPGSGGTELPRSGGPFDRVDLRVILAGAGSSPDEIEAEGRGRLLAILAPGSAPENGAAFEARGAVTAAESASASADAPSSPSEPRGDDSDPTGDGKMAETSPGPGGRGDGEQDGAGGPIGEPPMRRPKRQARKSTTRPWLMILLLLLIGGVLAAAWLGFIEVPGITPAPDVDAALAVVGTMNRSAVLEAPPAGSTLSSRDARSG